MPVIRPSSDLRNNYNEISTICHQTNRPVYITKNGAGDLAVMSIELYELLTDKHILYKELEKGISSLEKDVMLLLFKLEGHIQWISEKIDRSYAKFNLLRNK